MEVNMLICPKCKSEYQEGYKECSECKCELIEIPDDTEKSKSFKLGTIIPFIVGISLILCSPIISYKLTSTYFIPNGTGIYDPKQFIWMLNAYDYSFLLVGSFICLPCILFWLKNKNNY
jgi:hypothetical protein